MNIQPRQTFLNLPKEKQRLFRDAALDEFARHSFDSASITRLVANLGIAKGSVYQYFESKFALFVWLVQESAREKAERVALAEVSGWSGLEVLYRSGLEWWRREPRWARLGLRLHEPSINPEMEGFRRDVEYLAHVWWLNLVLQGKEDGWIRQDVHSEHAAAFLTGVFTTGLMTAFMAQLGSEPDEWVDQARHISAENFDKALGVSSAMVGMARRALGVA